MSNETKNTNKIINTAIFIILLIIVLSISTGCVMTMLGYKIIKQNNTIEIPCKVNNLDNFVGNRKIILKENDDLVIKTYNELGIDTKVSKPKNYRTKLFIDLNKIEINYNITKLKSNLENINKDRVENKYASIDIKDGKLVINKEEKGNYVDIDKLEDYIADRLVLDTQIEIELKDFYQEFDKSKPTSKELQEDIDKFNNFKISYTNGYTLTTENLLEYIIVKDNKIVFNEDFYELCFDYIDNTIEKELLSYDTKGGTWEFTKHNGEKINVTGGTWGDYFDSDKETEFIIEQFKKLESVTDRIPVMLQDYEDKIPNTYIEISIQDQYLWYYENGELKLESKVVTGLKNRMDTPVGVYFISEKINGKYLRGPGYKTWVNKWMRITNQGHGLHDASWRGSFGGKIYTYDGSHGCINLPKKFAYTLYDAIKVNECVVIY